MEVFKFLCDLCSDTLLLTLTYVKAMGLEHKIDHTVRRNIGMASEGVAFKTEGIIDLEIEIQHVKGVWHTLGLTWQKQGSLWNQRQGQAQHRTQLCRSRCS